MVGTGACTRTLKAETTRPPAANRQAQQRKFNRFREEFNNERPHEALDMATPASVYVPSRRRCPTAYRRSNIQIGSRSVTSATTGDLAGTKAGSMYRAPALANTSAWRKSTMAYGMSISARSAGEAAERHMRIEDEFGRPKRRG